MNPHKELEVKLRGFRRLWLEKYEIVTEGNFTVNGLNAYEFTRHCWTGSWNSIRDVDIVQKKQRIRFSLWAEKDSFDENNQVMDEMLNSLRW